jgi:hypothetical protein
MQAKHYKNSIERSENESCQEKCSTPRFYLCLFVSLSELVLAGSRAQKNVLHHGFTYAFFIPLVLWFGVVVMLQCTLVSPCVALSSHFRLP